MEVNGYHRLFGFQILQNIILMLVTKQVTVAIDFHCIFSPTMEVNVNHHLFGYQHSSKYLIFVLVTKQLPVAIYFHSILFLYYER